MMSHEYEQGIMKVGGGREMDMACMWVYSTS